MAKYFDIAYEEDITDNVVKSLNMDTHRVSNFIDQNFPIFVRSIMK